MWTRELNNPFVKQAKLNDGEWTRFLASQIGYDDAAILEVSYPGFCKIDEQRGTVIKSMALSYLVLALAYFDILGDAKAAGLTLKPEYLDITALFLATIVGLQFALVDAKYSFFQTLYGALYDRSNAAQRTELVLRYPAAYDVIQFSRPLRGYPPNVFPKTMWGTGAAFITMLAMIGLGLVSMIGLSMMIAVGIWNTQEIPQLLARGAVLTASLGALASVLIPRQWGWPRSYLHYGTTNLLALLNERDPKRWRLRHQQIAEARVRAGWVPEDEKE